MAKFVTDNRDPIFDKGVKRKRRGKGQRFGAIEHVATKGHRQKREGRRRRLREKERKQVVSGESATFIKAIKNTPMFKLVVNRKEKRGEEGRAGNDVWKPLRALAAEGAFKVIGKRIGKSSACSPSVSERPNNKTSKEWRVAPPKND